MASLLCRAPRQSGLHRVALATVARPPCRSPPNDSCHTRHPDQLAASLMLRSPAGAVGVQVAVDSDTTLASPLTAAGEARRESRRTAEAALHHARRAKERTYPELGNSGRCRLVVLGIETGWGVVRRGCYLAPAHGPLPRPVCTPTTAECMHICLRASVVRPARLRCCLCLRDQPPFPAYVLN